MSDSSTTINNCLPTINFFIQLLSVSVKTLTGQWVASVYKKLTKIKVFEEDGDVFLLQNVVSLDFVCPIEQGSRKFDNRVHLMGIL